MTPPPELLDLLAISPHPDDAEMCCGGTLIKMARRGYRVGVLDLSEGELSSNGTVATRRAEAAAAAEVLGLAHRENLGLPDGWLSPWSGEDLPADERSRAPVARLVEALRRLRPTILLAPWREARHPDHRAASALVTKAAFFAYVGRYETDPPQPRFRPQRVLYYEMRHRLAPSFVVDISEVAEVKRAAIRCYASQFLPQPGAAPTLLNSPRGLDIMDLRDRRCGALIGAAQGEPFRCEESLALEDPVAFFRDAPPAELYD